MPDLVAKEFSLYSKVRVVLDFTEGGFSVFNHAKSFVPQNNGRLTAFSYAINESAVLAGFDPSTPVSEAETNIEKKFEVPGGGSMDVYAISFSVEGLILKPADTSSRAGCCKVVDGSHMYVADVIDNADGTTARAGSVADLALRLMNRAFVPFVQYGNAGYQEYTGQMQWLPGGRAIDDGRGAKLQGPLFSFRDPIPFNSTGTFGNLLAGLVLKRDIATPPWADQDNGANAGDPGKTIRKQLGYAQVNAAPGAAGTVIGVIDVAIRYHGERASLAGD